MLVAVDGRLDFLREIAIKRRWPGPSSARCPIWNISHWITRASLHIGRQQTVGPFRQVNHDRAGLEHREVVIGPVDDHGIRPFGFSALNSGLCWSPERMSTILTVYSRPNSSRVHEALWRWVWGRCTDRSSFVSLAG